MVFSEIMLWRDIILKAPYVLLFTNTPYFVPHYVTDLDKTDFDNRFNNLVSRSIEKTGYLINIIQNGKVLDSNVSVQGQKINAILTSKPNIDCRHKQTNNYCIGNTTDNDGNWNECY